MPRAPSARSHAARTCIACKRGKRRCELPSSSQRLEGGVTLLQEDSCTRCRRLDVPCILDATYRYAHLHTLTTAPTPPPPIMPITEEPNVPVKVDLHTHPKSVDDYQRFFPRYLPFTLMNDFYVRTAGKLPKHPCLMDVPDVQFDDLVSDEHAEIASKWCQDHVTWWLPFTPTIAQVRKLRRAGATSYTLLFLEAALCDLALQHAAFPISPTNADKVATWTAWYCRQLIADPRGEYLSAALLLAAWFLPLLPDNTVYRDLATRALQSAQDDTFESRISRVCASALLGGALLNDDDAFYVQSAALQLPSVEELDELEAEIGASPSLSNQAKAGCHAIILRCRAWIVMKKCVVDMGDARRSGDPESKQLARMDTARIEFTNASKALCARRGAILSVSPLAAWLDFENCALDLLISGMVLHFTLGDNFTPQYFYDVSTGEAGSESLQTFMSVHGPLNAESTECMLAAVSNLPTKDVLYPTTLTFAYAMRGVIMALEIHATSFKLWRLPPPREPVWNLLLRSVDDTLRRLKGGGGQVAARIAIASVGAARETIRRWRAELVRRPFNPNHAPRPTITPDGPSPATAKAVAAKTGVAGVVPGTLSAGLFSGFEPAAGFELQGFDPMVTSFAEWIAGIDWNQFVVTE
ncbi:hypothetical protein CC85DRAFT_289558 [Cutaneotrichosporon oleaginosum]|uniref:Zn(2)-C6 fungal-type domain-containing protein n=1 Tax=Cutaneotrichosporon oleaginosum TaxID=879819 RepID=A0A0J0XBG5_9TREE|nr:uncharacterized protein CC85DRAFT_289558 [Cutaneotrichosporon oleaginosum]KLT38410.1 hypothetical protein CC85DRAFT_289558 [Cutaneotrichosporon oleaginosum]TXT09505.1 hypothetical protein COLE_03439 [Cutaneotrichosporon oleaginosum]